MGWLEPLNSNPNALPCYLTTCTQYSLVEKKMINTSLVEWLHKNLLFSKKAMNNMGKTLTKSKDNISHETILSTFTANEPNHIDLHEQE